MISDPFSLAQSQRGYYSQVGYPIGSPLGGTNRQSLASFPFKLPYLGTERNPAKVRLLVDAILVLVLDRLVRR